jgi:16S rRNA (guanine1207-N2)-methyltransferase
MIPDTVLNAYHTLEPHEVEEGVYYTKVGMRVDGGDRHPGLALLHKRVIHEHGVFIDASGSAGRVALALLAQQAGDHSIRVLEASHAALRCAQATFSKKAVEVMAGAPWDVPHASVDTLCLMLATDKGNVRVQAELQGALGALREGGKAYLLMHKDQGAKRYEREAETLFGEVTVLAKSGGWRLTRAVKAGTVAPPVDRLGFGAAGLTLVAEPGVFAAGKLDPGSKVLMEVMDWPALVGQRVLDLGCGYGILSLKASLAGADVTALDDDLLAVRSTYLNARHYGLDVRVLHSDVNSALAEDERFDQVIMNPPFHVAKTVLLDVPKAFLAAAWKHLRPGGILTLVANQALPYEKELDGWKGLQTLVTASGFKVLRALKP